MKIVFALLCLVAVATAFSMVENHKRSLNNFGMRTIDAIKSQVVPMFMAAPQLAKAGDLATRAGTCSAATTCAACTAASNTGCVWSLLFSVDNLENPTGFGVKGWCVTGNSTGPDPAGLADGQQFFGFNLFGGDDRTWWDTTNRPCDVTFKNTLINLDPPSPVGETHVDMNKMSVEITSGHNFFISMQQLQELAKEGGDAVFFDLIVSIFRGIRITMLDIQLYGGTATAGALDRTAMGVVYFGIDLGDFLKAIFEAISCMSSSSSGSASTTTCNDNPFASAAVGTFYIFALDSVATYAYTAGAGLTTATTVINSYPITGLTITQAQSMKEGAADIEMMKLSGNLKLSDGTASGVSFALSCYFGTETWTHNGMSISPYQAECDIWINNVNAGASNAAGLRTVILAMDIKDLLSATPTRAGTVKTVAIGAGIIGYNTMAGNSTANPGQFNVVEATAADCTNIPWITTEVKQAITQTFHGGSVTFGCMDFGFDTPNPMNIYWDPSGGVDKTKADAAVAAKSAAFGIAPVATLVVALVAALFLVL